MVSEKTVRDQLNKLNFKPHGWGKGEVNELHNILIPDEEIYDLVNGIYEGGFALLVSTDIRLLLVDKKPLNYLTVEDMRFDQINELDYSHRLLGAYITISSGPKTLRFRSYNQPRLRKVINHVQHCMAEVKKRQFSHAEDQKGHLEQINQQLQAYLIAQHHQQEQLHQQLMQSRAIVGDQKPSFEPLKPPPELADFLYAQRLLADYRAQHPQFEATPPIAAATSETVEVTEAEPTPAPTPTSQPNLSQLQELYADGTQEIFGKRAQGLAAADTPNDALMPHSIEINPLNIAKAKLPMALRNRKFGRPLFHDHSQAVRAVAATQPAANEA